MSASAILLVRHPETQANADKRYLGRGDSPLTAAGRTQSRRLVRAIAAFAPDDVWSSPAARCENLARRAAAASTCGMTVEDRLVELDFGAAEGLTFVEASTAGLGFQYVDGSLPVVRGAESRDQLIARVAPLLRDLAARPGRHVIVTHAGVVRASLVLLLGLPHDSIWAFAIPNGSMARVHIVEGKGSLQELCTA